MADAKLSELTAVTTAAATDILYTVRGSDSKKTTVATLFADVATPVSFSDSIAITDTNTMTAAGEIITTTNITYLSNPDADGNYTMTSTGAIILTSNITFISNPDAGGNCTLAAGVDGQLKIIIMTGNTGGHTVTLQDSTIANDISFDAAGDTATMLYTNSKWYFIGGTATVS